MKSTKKKTPSTTRRSRTRHPVIPPIQLDTITATARWFPEPELEFSAGENSCDPKVGVPLYGPRSLGTGRHKNEIHIGFIGTRPSVSAAQSFLSTAAEGVSGDDDHAPFPGCTRDDGYRMVMRTDDATVELITRQESEDVLKIRGGRQRFETFLQLLEAKIALLAGKDHPFTLVGHACGGVQRREAMTDRELKQHVEHALEMGPEYRSGRYRCRRMCALMVRSVRMYPGRRRQPARWEPRRHRKFPGGLDQSFAYRLRFLLAARFTFTARGPAILSSMTSNATRSRTASALKSAKRTSLR